MNVEKYKIKKDNNLNKAINSILIEMGFQVTYDELLEMYEVKQYLNPNRKLLTLELKVVDYGKII